MRGFITEKNRPKNHARAPKNDLMCCYPKISASPLAPAPSSSTPRFPDEVLDFRRQLFPQAMQIIETSAGLRSNFQNKQLK
jgi:hypothetical protein